MEIRLQKFIADAGLASRRAAEKLIANGDIMVNGVVVTEMGVKIDPSIDVVVYENQVLEKVETLEYYLLHKPVRVVSTASDENNRKTVVEMIPSDYRLYPVGRLDYMSSGLLILTNDGDMTYKLTHPKHDIAKHYKVSVMPPINQDDISHLRSGVNLDGDITRPCEVILLEELKNEQVFSIILHEGKNRQIRRMFEAVGSKVITLERVAIGKIQIEGLAYGAYRRLTSEEVNFLKNTI